jgi:hypothetical protein
MVLGRVYFFTLELLPGKAMRRLIPALREFNKDFLNYSVTITSNLR